MLQLLKKHLFSFSHTKQRKHSKEMEPSDQIGWIHQDILQPELQKCSILPSDVMQITLDYLIPLLELWRLLDLELAPSTSRR
jgi:hypothetical protein